MGRGRPCLIRTILGRERRKFPQPHQGFLEPSSRLTFFHIEFENTNPAAGPSPDFVITFERNTQTSFQVFP